MKDYFCSAKTGKSSGFRALENDIRNLILGDVEEKMEVFNQRTQFAQAVLKIQMVMDCYVLFG